LTEKPRSRKGAPF